MAEEVMLIPNGGPVSKMAVMKKIWPYATRHASPFYSLWSSLTLLA